MDILSLIPFVTFGYLIILFLIAYFSDGLKERGRSLAANPYVYSLSLTVYCTAWTFYGSVGLFGYHGFEYMPVYIGATFSAFTWWHILRKIIDISKKYNTTSIADFISTRFGKCRFLAGFIALMILFGLLPYIALQLKSINNTLTVMYSPSKLPTAGLFAGFQEDHAFYVAIILSVFGALFGARKLDATERHEGMVMAIAFEGIIKLIAFLAAGIYITFFIFDGYKDILQQGLAIPEIRQLYTIGDAPTPSYFQWFSLILLSGVAVIFLPRQFHVAVIENHDKNHIKVAMFLFPLYLFLMNLFVPAIAIGGRLFGLSPAEADLYVLKLPMLNGNEWLTLLVFIGGFSAATGMLIVETVAISTMIINHIVTPFLINIRWKIDITYLLIHLKRITIFVVLMLGYVYFKLLEETRILVDIGLMSFCAVLQFAPSTIMGIYWAKANRSGAIAGIISGFIVWAFTLFIPSLADAIPVLKITVQNGLFGLTVFKPSALFYLDGLDIWSHSIFWSLFFNFFFLISLSIIVPQARSEKEIAVDFTSIHAFERTDEIVEIKQHISRSPRIGEYHELLIKFIGKAAADAAIKTFLENNALQEPDTLTSHQAFLLRIFIEKTLAAYMGATTAKNIVDNYLKIHGTEVVEILDIFHDVSESLKQSREALAIRVKELSLFYSSLQKLMSTLSDKEIMGIIIDILVKDFSADGCAVIIMDSDGKLRIKKHSGLPESIVSQIEFEATPTTYVGKSFEEKRVIQIEDIGQANIPLKIPVLADGSKVAALAIAPIIVAGKPLGVVFVMKKSRQFFTDQFLNFLQGIASQVGLALHNARLYRELDDLNRDLENKVADRTLELRKKSSLLEEANKHLKEVDRLKSQFLATMSHELRTPLNSIIGYTQLIMDGVDGEPTGEQKEDLERIERNAKHLLQLINDILDLSKIEAGRMEFNITKIEFREILDQVIPIMQPLIGTKLIKVEKDIEEGPLFLHADKQRIEQILINLLSNAIKFTNEGSITIGCKKITDHFKRGWAEIYVRDTGIGIAKENVGKIFEAFRQIEESSTRKYGGTGLGLNITKKLVEMHGGSIWFVSEPGKGTTMTFTIPMASEDASKEPYKKAVYLPDIEKTLKHRKIVIIEERQEILGILDEFLTREGYAIEHVSVADAYAKIKETKPFSIVIDLLLTEKDSWEMLRKLKEDKEIAAIPIILISLEKDARSGYTVGPVDYIIKPLIKEEVLRELKKIESSVENKYVYIVDDDPDTLVMLGKIVREAGYELKSFTAGKELIEMLNIEVPGVILLDLFMPEINGFDVIQYIKNEEKLSQIPIIVITGGELSTDEMQSLQQNVSKVFIKSIFSKDELLGVIKRSLDMVKDAGKT